MRWIKIDAGEYRSEDGRFTARMTYDRIYGDHWKLTDKTDIRNEYHESTLKECKRIVELTISKENGTYKPNVVISDNVDDLF